MYNLNNIHIIGDASELSNIRLDCIVGDICEINNNILWSLPDVIGYINSDKYILYKDVNVPIHRYQPDRIILIASKDVKHNINLLKLAVDNSIPVMVDSISATIRYYRERKEWDYAVQILLAATSYIDNHILFEGYLCLWYKYSKEEAETFVMNHINKIIPDVNLWKINSQWYSEKLNAMLGIN